MYPTKLIDNKYENINFIKRVKNMRIFFSARFKNQVSKSI